MKPKGFTLIELLIVIATIGILAAFIGPYLTRDKHNLAPVAIGQKVGGLNCVGGFLFSTDANGNTRPATDAEGNASRC